MKVYKSVIVATIIFAGCETVYHSNTVYQHDYVAPDATLEVEHIQAACIQGPDPFDWMPTVCTERAEVTYADGFEDTGYCCRWKETVEHPSELNDPTVCRYDWCWWESTCSWEYAAERCH